MNQPQDKNWWRRNWKWFLPVGCLGALVFFGGLIALMYLVFGIVKSSGGLSLFDYEQQQQAEAEARKADPQWQPATEEVAVIQVGGKEEAGELQNFCLDTNGDLLACWGNEEPGKNESARIERFSPDGKLLKTWPLPSTPEAICVAPDGAIFVGGAGRILQLDPKGKVLASVASPAVAKTVDLDKAAMESDMGEKLSDKDLASYKEDIQRRRLVVTGIAVSGDDLFVACPSVSDFSYSVYRLGRDLKNATLIVKGLQGCCGQMDIQARDGKLWIAHNGRHRVESYDREGKALTGFGKSDRKAAAGFGGCCEPKNLRLGAGGNLYAAESGPPVAIKRFSPEGKFGGVVALPSFKSGCVRATVEVSADGKRFYIMDTEGNSIHVFAVKN